MKLRTKSPYQHFQLAKAGVPRFSARQSRSRSAPTSATGSTPPTPSTINPGGQIISQAADALADIYAGRYSAQQLQRNPDLLKRLLRSVGVSSQQIQKYAKGSANNPGVLSELISALSGRRVSASTVSSAGRAARELLKTINDWFGRNRGGGQGSAPPGQPPGRSGGGGGGRTPPPPSPPPPPSSGAGGGGGAGGQPPKASKFTPQRGPVPAAGESPYGKEVLTPQSSNVFSFSYDPEASILYVTFKGVTVSQKKGHVTRGKGVHGGREQFLGKLGSTITGRTNSRGAQYAYLDVPARVYERMKLASSKGKFVWSELRIRGSIYGHRYRYMLVQGGAVSVRGQVGTYTPRKATKRGFQPRSTADAGIGRRGYESSTLPATRFGGRSGLKPRGPRGGG